MSETPVGTFELAQHLPALVVVVPLIASSIVALIPRPMFAWFVATLATFTSAVFAVLLLFEVQSQGVISYAMGGWKPPFGIEYRVDILNAFVVVIVALIGSVCMPFALKSVPADVETKLQPWFYAIYLLCLTGLLGMAITGDAFNIFVFMEISSLATYVLIAMGRDSRALLAAYQYLIMGTIGATFYVLGIGLLYIVTGTLNLADLAERIGPAFAEQPAPDHGSSRLPGCRHQPEACSVPSARVVAKRLYLRASLRDGFSGGDSNQGRGLHSVENLLQRFRNGD